MLSWYGHETVLASLLMQFYSRSHFDLCDPNNTHDGHVEH